MHDHEQNEFSFKNYFVPLTTTKAVHWIIVIGLVVFANMLFNGFVWDDITYIIINPEVHTFNLFHLFSNNEFNSSGYYRPIPAVYFALIYVIFGAQSFFYHFLQLCLNIVDACLVFYFLKKFFRLGLSFFLTLIFLVHPIQVESVSYIGASQSEIFFFFGIVALLISTRKTITRKNLITISGLLLLSLLTKETGILFILMILLFQFLYYRKRTLLFIPYVIASSVFYLFIRFVLARVFLEKNDFIPLGHFSFVGRLINVPAVVYYYI